MNPPPKKNFYQDNSSPETNPKYTKDITILNTAPKYGDLWSLFQQPGIIMWPGGSGTRDRPRAWRTA